MKIWQWLMGAVLVLSLTGCGIFFAPLEGRWNPLDPDFGAGYSESMLYPTADGYVNSMGAYFGEVTMASGYTTYPSLALLKFDTSDIPKDVPHAELRLYLSSGGGTYAFRVRLILQDWDSATVAYDQVMAEGFLAPLFSPAVVVSAAGQFYSWDVTELLRSVTPDSMKGLLVEPAEGMGSAYFNTTRYATNQPHLVIWKR